GSSEQRKPPFQSGQLFRGGDLGGAMHGSDVALALPAKLVVSVLKHRHKRAGLELLGNGCNVLKPLSAAEGAEKTRALRSGALQRSPLGKNHGPGKDAEYKKDQEHNPDYQASLCQQIHYFGAHGERNQGSRNHCKSKCLYDLYVDRNTARSSRQTGEGRNTLF